ncbi:MAG: M48 family metallopeptidase [Paracoccaceae bacterium]
MAESVAIGQPAIPVTIRRMTRARRLTLRLDRVGGGATLTVPNGTGASLIAEFLGRHEDWLRRTSAGVPARISVSAGIRLPVEGTELTVAAGRRGPVRREGSHLVVPGAAPAIGPAAAAFLRVLARERLSDAVGRYCGELGVQCAKLTLRDPRSRWGSCTGAGNLMFSWRLAMAPPAVLRYVAAHEVGHLLEMNHSPAFWDIVSGLVDNPQTPRLWLRREGASLHRYVFSATA